MINPRLGSARFFVSPPGGRKKNQSTKDKCKQSVWDIMSKPVRRVPDVATITDASRAMEKYEIGSLVVSREKLLQVFSQL